MRAETHIWKTGDGRHILDGNHPDAALLAYAAGDEVPDKVIAELTDAKQRTPQANKSRPKPADKAASKPDDK